jgi:hypothetical protein
MALPPSNHPCWTRAATGGMSRLRTTHLGTQLLSKRIERSADPTPQKVAEIVAFFTKWERILPNEIAQLPTL